MKDIFNRRQRFSLRKYSIGVCSVLLGTALFAAGAQSASADEATAAPSGASTSASTESASDSTVAAETTASSTEASYDVPAANVDQANTGVAQEVKEQSEANKAAAKAEEATKPAPKAEETVKPAKAEEVAKPAPKAEAPKATATSEAKKADEKSQAHSATSEATKPAASTSAATSESSEAASESEAAAVALNPRVKPTSLRVTAAPTADRPAAEDRSAVLDRAATDMTNGGALATGRSRRSRRAVTNEAVSADHNTNPVSVSTYLKDGETVDPTITNPNGATVKSQEVPAGYARKEGDWYTYSIIDLTRFNERYNTNYYTRAYKRFDDSTETTVELIDKTTGNVVETRTLSASSGIQKFTTTTAASNGQLTVKYDYNKGLGAGPGKTDEPFIQFGYEVGASIQALVNPKNEAEQKLYTDVYNARTSTDIINVVEPAYNGRTITDSNAKIPKFVEKPTYYRVVDKNNATFNANKTDKTVQDYVPNGKEVDLAKYATKAMEGQHFTASGERQFDGYKLYQTANSDSTTGFVSRPYVVGTKFMDAERAGIKRIKEIVGEDGSVVVRVYLLDPKQQSKRSDGTLSTDGYMLLAETKPIKPGEYNTQDLVVKKSPLNTIAFTDNKGVNHPNGVEVPFDFQTAAGYTPKKTVFVPFLGDGIGHLSPNSQLENGAYVQIGTNVDLLNSLTPYKPTVYYYVKQEPVEVIPEVEKQLDGRVLTDGEFTFKLTEEKSTPDKHEETVTNKDGKATFSKLTFNKVGTYKYKITEQKGSDANVDYDAMTVTMTVNVTENAQGDLQATVKYSAEGGFSASADDKIFNNYVVAPVKVKFDFTKKLAGRELKDGEFKFILKDANGQEVETVANKKDGTVTFTEISFDNTKVGTHTYTVEEVIPATKEVGMTYDAMKATITVEVAKNGHALTTVTNVSSTGGVDANGNATDGTADKEFNNKITPPETPEFQPEKFVLNKEKFDITGTKLVDDDDELTDEYADTNANPYADKTTNNEAENINTKTVERGEKLVYQVWLDTKNFTDKNNIQSVGISDTYDADKLTVNVGDIKAYDSVTGEDVSAKFDIKVENGVITATSKASMNKSLGDADNTQVIDTTKFAFGRYYKFDIPATVKADVAGGVDIENKANQIVHVYNPVSKSVETPEKPTQKRVNSVPITAEFNFTKRLEGRALTAGEFTFELKDSDNVVIATATNDADGKIKFSPVEYTNKAGEKVTALKYKKGQEGTYTYSVTEVKGTDATVTYDTMKAEVTVTVSHDGTAKALVANVTEPADKEFNNTVTPPTEPKFQPEKYVLNTAKYSITDNKLLDDDAELTDKYGETNTDPYVDKTNNNEAENINTKTVDRGDKLYYQVWLDTTKFSATNKENVQSVGITDDFDETKVDVDGSAIKAYDSVTGDDVTNKFDIKVENGVMTATLKAGFTKSLGDAENTQIIDTTKFAFGRYYKFDIPATVKADVPGGSDIENTAAQVVNYYNPVSKTVEKPSKPTEKRVNNVPVEVEFNFTKRLEGRELKANEFSFVLKDSTGKVVETVSNDKDGNVKFSALTFKKGEEGVHNYTVEEVAGTDATVTYDTMKATVAITVEHKGTAKVLVAKLGEIADKEFNNRVTPPEEPKFQPEKYVVSKEKYDITGDKLVDDDRELADKYADTNANPYADDASNNEAENLNTKTVERGSKLVYQVWLDTTKFDAANKDNIQTVGISDNYDEAKLNLNAADIKAYDSVTGAEVTDKFDIAVNNGVITANLKAGFTKSLGDAENTQVIDTTKFEFGRYYKFDIPTTVKDDVVAGADIENTAAQVVNYYNPTTKKVEKPEKPTEKRVNNVPISVEFNFTKKLEGRALKANEFTFELKDSDNVVIATATNDAAGNFKFTPVDYTNKAGKTVTALKYQKGQEGTYTYTVTEVKGTDSTVTYDEMSAVVTVTVSHDGTAKALITNVTEPADKEFNNKVTPPEEPKFQPEKYVVSKAKFDITGTKLVDDDSELTDKYGETNTNPYVDTTANNEDENLNTKPVERGQKLYYQVWLDTTKFSATNKENIQTVGITDNYDKDKLTVNASDIKVYDSVTGADVTTKFDISDNNGVLTANLKDGFTKSLGDAENTQIIDTTKFEFGRYYKFDIPATVKDDVVAGADIENKAAQVVNYYNPVSKTVEKPNKPTEKRVNSVPISVEFNFTKKLEGRELKAGEFTFELKDSDNVVIASATNDAAGKIKFAPVDYTNKAGETVTALKYKKGQEGTYKYTVEEVKGTDATVEYDTMKAVVTVEVRHDGTAKALITNVTEPADKEFNNTVRPPEEPKFQPEKYVVSKEKFDITGDKLVDDDKELADKYADTNANPYADDASNNEKENLNTKTVKRGDKLVYQVWLDTTKFDAANKDNIQSVGISDDYDEAKLELDSTKIKAYDSVTGAEVTDKFDITVNNGVITATLKDGFTKSLGDAENTQVIDTTKFEFGRYYKFDIPTTVKADVPGGVDIENTAAQVVNYYNPTTKKVEKPSKPTEKRVNNVPVEVEFNFTKRLEGRELKANEFSFVLKDSTGKEVETVSNDASGNVKFKALEFKKGDEGVHNYTVEEVKGSDATVTYDTMKANVTVTVKHDGTAKVLIATVGDIADKEFNNRVTPPEEPKFQPEKYVLNTAKFSITDNKLLDDDAELTDKYGETNTDPYVDKTDNNEAENINTKTVKRGEKIYYQVWLDTTKFDAANKDNVQTVGITDNFDETKVDVDGSAIKAYDSVTGADVTNKFDITVNNGVITATLKDGFTKSLGDAENTQIIDTTKFEFGRYYKFDIPATVKNDVPGGADIENTAAQVVNYYNPVSKTVEKPNKPTEKRVNNVPVEVEFNFTKRLEGRELKANEFSFVLKDASGKVVETVSNDAAGNVAFSPLSFKKGEEGVHNYTVEEVKGSDATVTYDTMKANVTVTVKHDGTAKVLIATVGDIADKEFNNRVTPPEEPKFNPEKYVVSEAKFDVTGTKLVDDDKELANKVADTNANPYADDASNNEEENLNTKTVKRGQKLYYQVWLDTTQFDAANKDNIQTVGITDDFDETKLTVNASDIKAYDSVSGADVTSKFDISIANGVITANLKDGFTKSLGDTENTQIIDTTKFEFGRYYKFDIPATVNADVPGGADIENTATQVVNYYNPTTKKVEKPSKPTEKRVNNVPVEVEFNFTKRLEGRELKANEFSFVLKDSEGKTLETVSNDAAGNVKFSKLEFKKGQEGVHNYTVEEVKGSDATVTYDTMKANVTVTVKHDGTAKVLIATVGDIADKEFNNRVTPPEEPKFQPEKYVVSEEKFDITGDKLVDDDKELADKYADTNANPYADDASNNEAQNLNTKTVKRGDKLVYQVWLDTTKFDAANKDNIQSVGISDDYDEAKLELDSTKIKAYDSVTGAEVTDKFDITVNNGVITATLKDGFTKSLGDAENTQVIDTTKFEFGRYYKFDIPTTVKADVPGGVDIENTAAQVVNYYNPTTKKVEKPSKPTEQRVNNVPVEVEFNFTKRLEGRELKANEFSFVLKDSEGNTLETVKNDASGNVKFSALEFKKGQEGVHNYTVEEVKGSDATVTYDTMKANVTVTVSHDGTAKILVATVGKIADKEFNNRVTPPETPEFNPEKYVLNEKEFDLTGTSLLDDDKELADKYADTNANPYADDASNNEKANINTKSVKPGQKLVYQVWLDTTKFDANNKDHIQSVGISDDYDEAKVDVDGSAIKAYDGKTGADVTAKFDITVNNGVITATLKDGFTKSLGDAENTQVIDTTKFEFGRYYKFDIPATVKADVAGGVDIENTAAQVVNYYNPTTKKVEKPEKPTEKRVNSVPVEVEFNFTKRMEGRELKANEFSFVLKDSEGKTLETVKNDKDGNVKFSKLEFKKGQEGVHNYTVEEVKGSDATVTYDTMKANVTVTVSHDGKAKVLIAKVGDIADKEFNNKVTPPETPEFNPEKYILNAEKFDLTGKSLLDDDKELADKVAETNANPYADKADNNEAANINTKTVKRGDKVVYQVWLDTTKFTEAHNIQSVGVTDDYEEDKLDINVANIKAYDSVTGEDVTAKFDIKVENGVISATSKADLTKSLGDAENTPVIDTTKFAFGRYYKFDIPATVKDTVKGGADIENTAAQIVHQYDPTSKTVKKPNKPTEKRVVNIPVSVEFNFTKRLEGRELKANEFSFVLKDKDGKTLETVKNDASGNVKFSALEFKKGQEGTYNYTVEEVKGTDTTVTYDTMKAVVTVEVSHDGTAKALLTKVTDPSDKEFNNTVRPPETPEFNPEKYILNESKFDLTGVKLLDDDDELKNKVADTNANPYVDKTDNNEAQNINTKTLKKGDKVYYQVWLDTTKFTEAHNIQSVGVTDKYDSANLTVNGADIKAYDSVTGEDVTAKFDIKVENGVITATSKADLTKSLGDAENTQVIDTTKLAFGRYYKFEIPAEIKQSAQDGVDIENTASQIVHQYDPTKKTVEKPEKPTEKRVVNIPVKVQFQFTKKLEGRALKAGEFSFVLKDEKGNVIETVSNDAAGKITFSNLEFKRGEEGTHLYHVEEIRGTDSSIEYDKMVATVGIMINKDGKVLTAITQLPEDTEFNNTVIPPTTPPNTPPTTPPNTPPTTPPNTPPTPPTTPPTPPTPPTPTTPPAPALPETGEEQSASAALLGAALGMVGLAGLAKRKKRED